MSDSVPNAEARFAELARRLATAPGGEGPKRKGFGQHALWAGTKMFAFLDRNASLVVKLPRDRVSSLVAAGVGHAWDPGHGRPQKEWMALEASRVSKWLPLAREAREYVGAMGAARPTTRRRPK